MALHSSGLANVRQLSVPELLTLSRSVLHELRSRGVLRTANAPAGDYAEYLVAKAYGGQLAPNSEKSWDVRTPDERKLQVKARVVTVGPGTKLFSPFRSFEFDAAVLVLLRAEDLSVLRAVELPKELVQAHSTYRAHVNGWVVRTAILSHNLDGARDVTALLARE